MGRLSEIAPVPYPCTLSSGTSSEGVTSLGYRKTHGPMKRTVATIQIVSQDNSAKHSGVAAKELARTLFPPSPELALTLVGSVLGTHSHLRLAYFTSQPGDYPVAHKHLHISNRSWSVGIFNLNLHIEDRHSHHPTWWAAPNSCTTCSHLPEFDGGPDYGSHIHMSVIPGKNEDILHSANSGALWTAWKALRVCQRDFHIRICIPSVSEQ